MELRPYQCEAVAFLGESGFGLYADPPGTGKTPTTLQLLRDTESGHILLVAPKTMLPHWERQAGFWYPELEVVVGTGTPKRRADARERVGRLAGGNTPAALLVNYEVVRSDWAHLKGFPTIVCDEAHRLKNRSSQTFKAMCKIVKPEQSLFLLTGTPFINGAHEVWALLHLLDPRRYRSFWSWAEENFDITETTYGGKVWRPVRKVGEIRPGRAAALRDELADYMIRRPLAALIDLPPVTETLIPVTLTPRERKLYDSVVKHSWGEKDGKLIVTVNEVSKTTRLRQLASEWGGLVDTEGLGSKADTAVNLVADLAPEQVVILTAYKATAYALSDALSALQIDVAVYTGDQDADERTEALRAFQAGTVRVIVGTLATMSEGVDGLQIARHLIMLDRDWTPARNEQAIARLARSGQENPVIVYHLYAENTVDQMVAEACSRKQAVIDTVMGSSVHDILIGAI